MLLFKNGFKKFVKDYMQFVIFILLILLSVVFTSTFGISSSNLIRTKDSVTKNYTKYDYSFRYTSSGYDSNDVQTLNPWFAFNVEELNNGATSFSTLTIGGSGVLRAYEFNYLGTNNYDSSVYRADDATRVNFGFGDTESQYDPNPEVQKKPYQPTPEQAVTLYDLNKKIETTRTGEFGRFFRFNFDSINFKNSLIGKLYEKYNHFQVEQNQQLSNDAIKAATSIFDYMFYLNNSAAVSAIKATIAGFYDAVWAPNIDPNTINEFVEEKVNFNPDDADQSPKSADEIAVKGFNGRIGRLTATKNPKYFFLSEDVIKNVFSSKKTNDYRVSQLVKNGTYLMKDFESRVLFWNHATPSGFLINQKNITSRNLFETYYQMLGNLTNFNIELTNEVVMWNAEGQKFRFISSFYTTTVNGVNNYNFYNPESYTIYKKFNGQDLFTRSSFMASNGYVKKNNWKLGNTYQIIPGQGGSSENEYRLDALGSDYYNIYPTIYEEDLLTNQANEAIFYINSLEFEKWFNYYSAGNEPKIQTSEYKDVSRAYMRHTGSAESLENDTNLFNLYVADNMVTLNSVVDAIENNSFSPYINYSRANLESVKDTKVLAFRSELLQKVTRGFMLLSITFVLIFVACIIFMIYTIIRKVMISQRGQIGNLKSLGYSNERILVNYILYMIFPTLIIVPIGWIISVFLQTPIMKIFELYFNIPTLFTVDWQFLLILLFAFSGLNALVVGLVAYATICKSPLELMAPSKSSQPNLFLTRLISKFRFRRFTSKLRMILISTSITGLVTFAGVITLSSFVLTFSSILPSSMSKMKQEYFSPLNYNNDYFYANTIANNPLTRNAFYSLDSDATKTNSEVSIFNTNIKVGDKYVNLLKGDLDANTFAQAFENVIYSNLTSFKGVTLSPGMFDEVILASQKTGAGTNVKNTINQFSCLVLPTLFGQEAIAEGNDYKACIKNISNNILPSTIKQMWTNEENFNNFTFNFSSIAYNSAEDEMYTQVAGVDEKTKLTLSGYGLDLFSSTRNTALQNLDLIKYNSDLDYIPVLINEKLKVRGYKVGEEFKINTTANKLALKNSSDGAIVANDAWSYEDSDTPEIKIPDLFSMNLSKFSYMLPKVDNQSLFYYQDANGEWQKYNNLANVVLKFDVSSVDKQLLQEVNDEYTKYSNKTLPSISSTGTFKVNPYDIYTYDNGEPLPIGLEQIGSVGTNSWMNIALNKGLLSNRLVDTESKTLKIVGVEKVYNGDRFYMDQLYANQLLGYDSFAARQKFSDGSSVNIWSNAKMSSNDIVADNFERYMLSPINMNNTLSGFAKYVKPTIGSTDYLKMTKDAMSNLISSTLAIVIVLILICIITSVIVIFLMTDMFVGRYKVFMSYMRIQGYYMHEINSVVMWIYLPLTVLGCLLGIGLVLLILYTAIPSALLAINIAVKFILNWWILGLVSIIVISIFATSYSIILKSLAKVQLSRMIG